MKLLEILRLFLTGLQQKTKQKPLYLYLFFLNGYFSSYPYYYTEDRNIDQLNLKCYKKFL